MNSPVIQPYPDLISRVMEILPADVPAYLVGGAVRDHLLGRTKHDLDFVLPSNTFAISRRVADKLGGFFFPLDDERETARVVLIQEDGTRQVLDFATMRGPDLESDLRDRDFTINAMALPKDDLKNLIDPLGGASDLYGGVLRACSPEAIDNDPIRILRGVRLGIDYSLKFLPDTKALIRHALPGLESVSAERLRDELFRMLNGAQPASALRVLDYLGALPFILPELSNLHGISQSPPHTTDVWAHTLNVLKKLNTVLNVLTLEHNAESAGYWTAGLISLRLGRYRHQIDKHMKHTLSPERSRQALLVLAALYHDVGKEDTRQEDEYGRIRFLGHERIGAEKIRTRAHHLRLSNAEITHLSTIVRHHLRPILLTLTGQTPSRRAIYRFYRDTGEAGVDVCLLSLADMLGTHGLAVPQDVWVSHVDTVRALLEALLEHPEESVSPPVILTGYDIMQALNLKTGPQIGRLLMELREAQATGEVNTRDQALDFVRARFNTNSILE